MNLSLPRSPFKRLLISTPTKLKPLKYKSKTLKISLSNKRIPSLVLKLRLKKSLLPRKSLRPKRKHSRLPKRRLMPKRNLTQPELLLRSQKKLPPYNQKSARKSSMLKLLV
jgi:hypothetical protein